MVKKLLGPFSQILTMEGLSLRGALKDEQMRVINNGGILIEKDRIIALGDFEELRKSHKGCTVEELTDAVTALPGLIDGHTHLCFAGSRANDFAARNSGKTYQQIAADGGGIWDTVSKTRKATPEYLEAKMCEKLDTLLMRGITTVEIKSGYGLDLEEELKILRVIQSANVRHHIDIVPTCLAAHIVPPAFKSEVEYLDYILKEIEPIICSEGLAGRFDIFIEENAFSKAAALYYLNTLRSLGHDFTVHGDQFTVGGSEVAIATKAISVDHLEAAGDAEVSALSRSQTFPIALPGASLGLGLPFAPARKLLDAGCSLAIASDWNPGSAPQGNLLTQAALLSTYQKLSAAEVFSALTFRAAAALKLANRGVLKSGNLADIVAFPTTSYKEILYHQGELQPTQVWKRGVLNSPVGRLDSGSDNQS